MTRSERRKRSKKKSILYIILIEYGLLMFVPFLLFKVMESVSVFLMILAILILPFFTKIKPIMLFANMLLLPILFLFLHSVNIKGMNDDFSILIVLFFILAVLFVFLVQVFFIIIKIYNVEVEKPPNTDKVRWNIKFLVKMIYYSNLIISKIGLLLPFLYYVSVTFLIIYIYAVLYNNLNQFYEIRGEQAGYYMSKELIMSNADDLGYTIYTNYGDVSEKNDSMRIPIVNIRFNKDVQNSNNYTSKQKQDLILREFEQNTLKVALSEYMYFSSTTFFTVGYGDVALKGRVPKLVAQTEMFIAGFFHIIFIPMFLFIITDYISKRGIRGKSNG